jgi:flavin-binding protein dodecin
MAAKAKATKDRVYKQIELVGTSTNGFEAAIENAVQRAGETLERLSWFTVRELRGALSGTGILEYQAIVTIAFEIR